MQTVDFTPMMRQYMEIKKQHEDYILFYRLGDFYEMFFDDAQKASKELDLTLTGKDCGQESRAPMCGVPYHSAESYIARLINRGYKVAVCEQTEDPATAKGLVKREVIRLITPGTVMESSMLEERRNNFICSVYLDSRAAGVCFCDVSTGQMHATSLWGNGVLADLVNELGQYMPREVLLSDGAYSNPELMDFILGKLESHVEQGGEWRYAPGAAGERVKAQFQLAPEQTEALTAHPELIQACGALLSYLQETQKGDLSYISRLELYEQGQFMELDFVARRNLELTSEMHTGNKKGSLLGVLDKTQTAMGGRLIRRWLEQPLLSVPQIQARQQAVQALLSDEMKRDELRELLSSLYDIERIMGRVVFGSAGGRDLRSLREVCLKLPGIKKILASFDNRYLSALSAEIDLLDDVEKLVDRAIEPDPPFSIREGGVIRTGFDPRVDELRELLQGGSARLSAIEAREKESTGIKNLKVSFNKVFGYYIEISKSYLDQVPESYIRKQTLTNCERYITQELKELEGEVLSAGQKDAALEYELFCSVREQVAACSGRAQRTCRAVAAADVLCSFALAAQKNRYAMPEVDYSQLIDIRNGRHPVVEHMLKDGLFVPNDTYMDGDKNRVYIITGPNMAGKSTYMRQVALIVIMAQCGSFVPAEYAHIGVCDRVFTRIGASDDMSSGLSTFMVEMNEVADILAYATPRSLLILDEIGRGTSTFDGISIARAVLEYVADKKTLGARTLFATHYHELCELEQPDNGVKNYNVVVKKRGDDIIFIKKIVPGSVSDSYGIEVANLAGLPDKVIRRAKAVLKDIEKKSFRPADAAEIAEEPAQCSLEGYAGAKILDRLKKLEAETLTPIEALNLLYELSRKAKEMEA